MTGLHTTLQMPERFDAATLGHGFAHRTVRADDVTLHCVVGGSGDPLVLLSGWPQSWYAWHKVMPALASRYTVAAIDLPGLGDSEKPADGYDTATVARRVRAGVRALGLDRILLVTHDIGTWVSFPYAHEYAAHVRKLVMMDAAIPGLYAPPPDPRLWHFGFNQQPGLGEALTKDRERVFIDWFFKNRTQVVGAIGERDIDEFERVYSAPGAMAASFRFYRAMPESARQNLAWAERARLGMPVLVLGSDSALGRTMVEAVGKLGGDVTGEVFAGCGHYIPEEMPERLLERVLPFLEMADKARE